MTDAPAPDRTYNGWAIIRTDAVAKARRRQMRALRARSSGFGRALVDLSFKACSCSTRPSLHAGEAKAPSIAHELAKTESFAATRRHRGW